MTMEMGFYHLYLKICLYLYVYVEGMLDVNFIEIQFDR